MASQITTFDRDYQFDVSSTLLIAPATSILNQIDDELGGMSPQAEETLADNSQLP
jgi:hypothetical protein